MNRSNLILIDAVVNLLLGAVLAVAPWSLASAVGLPAVGNVFYASILGAVLFGIGLALLIEWKARPGRAGLGLPGAVAINLSGGACLAGWLVSGSLHLKPRGLVILWGLLLLLVGSAGKSAPARRAR